MREIRPSGSEGGEEFYPLSLPLSRSSTGRFLLGAERVNVPKEPGTVTRLRKSYTGAGKATGRPPCDPIRESLASPCAGPSSGVICPRCARNAGPGAAIAPDAGEAGRCGRYVFSPGTTV